jgi:DNA-binding transcriptional MerR regulator
MKHSKKQYRIGHVAKELNVKRFVIRFWEREFNLSASRSHGGQRCYQQFEIEQLKLIKKLLYEEKFTIAGAKKYIEEHLKEHSEKSASTSIETFIPALEKKELPDTLAAQIEDLHKKLLKLRELL